jgi:NADH dehydrogenase
MYIAPYLDRTPAPVGAQRHVVIIGGGFGGLNCAQALGGSDRRVTLVDRRNHHLFQPLLYQVATAALSPADIATPIRGVLARYRNIDVVLAEVSNIDVTKRHVQFRDGGYVPYDDLVLATGSVYNYFAHPEWSNCAPSLKSIEDARSVRARLLRCFEDAESCAEPGRRTALLTAVIVGGGPTGVEMAGAVVELARYTLRRDFRRINPVEARVILVEAGPRLLSAFPEELSAYALKALVSMGVEVKLNAAVQAIDEEGVHFKEGMIPAGTVLWGAGIRAGPGAGWLGIQPDRLGRVPVRDNFSVPGLERVYAIGDVAAFVQDGQPVPALAQVATQQGRHLGRELRRDGEVRPFRYRTRGDTAVIGRNAAVYVYRRFKMKGRLAWLFWALIHVYLLIGFDKRTLVMTQWIWRYFTYERGARLIDGKDQAVQPVNVPAE